MMDRRMALMWQKPSGGSLPAEFQAVEWIGVSNTSAANCAYLSLPPELLRIGYSVALKIKQDATTTAEVGFLGQQGYRNDFELCYKNGVIQAWGVITRVSVDYGNVYDLCVAKKNTSDAEKLLLMTYRPDKYFFKGRCYGATFSDAIGRIIANLAPCYRKSDGVIGMFDLINNTFYTNAGTGSFMKGGDI